MSILCPFSFHAIRLRLESGSRAMPIRPSLAFAALSAPCAPFAGQAFRPGQALSASAPLPGAAAAPGHRAAAASAAALRPPALRPAADKKEPNGAPAL